MKYSNETRVNNEHSHVNPEDRRMSEIGEAVRDGHEVLERCYGPGIKEVSILPHNVEITNPEPDPDDSDSNAGFDNPQLAAA